MMYWTSRTGESWWALTPFLLKTMLRRLCEACGNDPAQPGGVDEIAERVLAYRPFAGRRPACS